jgi:uncharacterized protein
VEIDEKRKRIALTMRLADVPSQQGQRENKPEQRSGQRNNSPRPKQQQQKREPEPSGAMAAAFARLKG